MNILIIEDERLKKMVAKHLPEAMFHGHLDSISTAVKWLEESPTPDLIFCDIQLADGHSFEIFNLVKVSSPIIFTTAFDQYAIKAFKLNSIDYLLKPIDPQELEQAIRKFQSQQVKREIDISQLKSLLSPEKQFKERFIVKVGEKIHSILTEDIAFFFSAEKATYLQVHEGRKYIIDYPLDQLENMLSTKSFYRLNRKYIASFESIDGIFAYSNSRLKVKLKACDDQDILISREKVAEFKEWLDS